MATYGESLAALRDYVTGGQEPHLHAPAGQVNSLLFLYSHFLFDCFLFFYSFLFLYCCFICWLIIVIDHTIVQVRLDVSHSYLGNSNTRNFPLNVPIGSIKDRVIIVIIIITSSLFVNRKLFFLISYFLIV